MEKVDEIDLQIINLLQANSKMTNLELSKRIGLTPPPTLERVKKLEKAGIIEGYYARVNPQALGLHVKSFVLVSIDWHNEQAAEYFLNEIAKIDEVTECCTVTGEADFILKVICSDLKAYEELVFNRIAKIPAIDKLKTLMTLSTSKESSVLPYMYRE